ncbi:hypothetical protein EON81_05040 [bacterium]|nr:MAG: hypothetical protein EON81_05040 [bacterium]
MVAAADAKKQDALRSLREAELRATQIAQATADAEKMVVAAQASAEAEAVKLRLVSDAQAEAIRKVNQAISEGGDAYLALRQLEMIPLIAPSIANALAQARLVNISTGDGKGAAGDAANQIVGVIQTVLAAQLVQSNLVGNDRPTTPSQPAVSTVMPTQTPNPTFSPNVPPIKRMPQGD